MYLITAAQEIGVDFFQCNHGNHGNSHGTKTYLVNSWFHSEAELPLGTRRPLANHIRVQLALNNHT